MKDAKKTRFRCTNRFLLGVFLALAPLLCLFSPLRAAAQGGGLDPNDLLIIVNKNSPLESVSKDEIKNIFLAKRERWKNGEKAVPVHAPGGTDLRKRFVEQVLGMSVSDEAMFWQKRKIRHGATIHPEFSNTLKAVFKLKRSVSYILRKDYLQRVAKVVLVIPAD